MLDRARLVAIAAAGWTALVIPGGCRSPESTAPIVGTMHGDARWPYWPVDLRVHPLTRIVVPAHGDPVIEARIELLDRDGHTTKACGRLRLDLYDGDEESPTGSLAQWNLDLRDSALNRERFDVVTLTYLFRLEPDPDLIPARPVLHAYFLSADGTRMNGRLALRGYDRP